MAENSPLVSIIIPAHNCWDMTRTCVSSILRYTRASYEIILIDDACNADTAARMKRLQQRHVRVIRNTDRKCYSVNNNTGARAARGKYLCLLNNDTRVFPGWLAALSEVAAREEKLGVLGNKHLFPGNGMLHHCGMAFDSKGYPQHLYPGSDPAAPRVNYQCELQIVTFACVMIPASVYRELNGLDEEFRNGFEDCDFCLRAREAGYRVVYTPSSVIEHHGQASPNRTDYDNENWTLFRKRWANKIVVDWDQRIQRDRQYKKEFRTRRRTRHGDEGVHFAVDFSSGSAFTWATAELIKSLASKGTEVSVTPVFRLHHSLEPGTRDMLRSLMRKKPCNAFHVKWSHYWSDCLKTPLAGDVNAEFFCTNYRKRPDAMPDLWMRHVKASRNRLLPVSCFNRDALRDIDVDEKRMSIVPLGYSREIDSLFPDGIQVGDKERINALVITNSHDLKRYGTDILVQAAGMALSKDEPVTLHIKDYGAGCGNGQLEQWIKAQPDFPEVVWHRDFLSKSDLIRLYAEMDVLIAPYRGEGFGMKIIDAMALGIPVIMPGFGGPEEFAPEGAYMPLAYREVPVGECYDSAHFYLSSGAYWCEVQKENLAGALERLPASRKELVAVGKRGREHVRPTYSWDNIADRFMAQLRHWAAERASVVTRFNKPSDLDMSVIIPTRNREDILQKALAGYNRRRDVKMDWEMIIVNDGGDEDKLKRAVEPFRDGLKLRVMSNPGKPGPASARNAGIRDASGRIILITGDDIIPGDGFLFQHLKMHKKHPQMEKAVLGLTLWSPDLDSTPFMSYLCGEGGQQFAYRDLMHGKSAPFDRFYTSNVSLKRQFLLEEEHLFNTDFRYAAYEDIELAYRLHLRGMDLRYDSSAIGYHHHSMDPESFLQRQIRVGRMLTYLFFVQPAYVPQDHAVFLEACEFLRANPDFAQQLQNTACNGDQFTSAWAKVFQQQLQMMEALEKGRFLSKESDAELYGKWLEKHCGLTWEGLNELALRIGMAKEWAGGDEKLSMAASQWCLGLAMPTVLKKNKADFYDFLVSRGTGREIANPVLGILIHAYQRGARLPLMGPVFQRTRNSRFFMAAKQYVNRKAWQG
ncbi:MAG: glycosyltransferase [Verrucomicrobiota bacterium]